MKKRARQLKLPGQGDPQTRWLMAYFPVTLLVLWGWQELFQQFAVRTIPYSQFKAHLERHEVIDVTVKQDEIVDRIVPLAARQTNAVPAAPVISALNTHTAAAPLGLRRALAEAQPFFFRTVRVEDPELVKQLQVAGVEYRGNPAQRYFAIPPRVGAAHRRDDWPVDVHRAALRRGERGPMAGAP